MRSLHGHAHLCVVVLDADRLGKPTHLLVANGIPIWPLFHYFQLRNLQFSSERTYAQAIGLFIDYIAAKGKEFSKIADRSRLFGEQSDFVAYRCINKQGEIGRGFGRISRDGEYSRFLKRTVRAGLFIIFKYDRTGKEYWFKPSNCARE